jgi:hypothetical protein
MSAQLDVPESGYSDGDGTSAPITEYGPRTRSILPAADTSGGSPVNINASSETSVKQVPSRPTNMTTNKECSTSVSSWKKRVRHVTWAYFTLTMATGGLANVLYSGNVDYTGWSSSRLLIF